MKNHNFWIITFLLLITVITLPAAALDESERETFLKNFEANYDADLGWVIDSANPYVKTVGIVKTTKSGISVMLDKVLVTEDELAVSFLISGDFPENLFDVQLSASIDAGPLLPYPPELSFEPKGGGGGGDPVNLRILNEEPLVALDTKTISLMYSDRYISASNPIQVHVRVPRIAICWDYSEEDGKPQCYHEDEALEFEFETDGAELAAQTKTFELDHNFEINGKIYDFHRLRFNPMQLILFTGNMLTEGEKTDQELVISYFNAVDYVQAEADDGTKIYLEGVAFPYRGFKVKILDPETIKTLKQTQTLTLTPCGLSKPKEEYAPYPFPGDPAYDCNPKNAVTVTIRD